MRIDPLEQLKTAAAAFLLGVAVCVFYDLLSAVRHRSGMRVIRTLCDAVFCAAVFLGLFTLGFTAGGGRQRIYMAVFAAGGGAAYFATLSKLVSPACSALVDMAVRLARLLLLPLALAARCAKKFTVITKNVFHYGRRWYTMSWGRELIPQTDAYGRQRPRSEGTVHNETQKGRYYY